MDNSVKDNSVKVAWIGGGLALAGTVITVIAAIAGSSDPPISKPADSQVISPGTQGTSSADLYANRTSGPVGARVLLSGKGFQPGEEVVLRLGPQEVGRTKADIAGGFSNVGVDVDQFFKPFPKPMSFAFTATGRESLRYADVSFTVS